MLGRLLVTLAAAVVWCGCAGVGTVRTGDGEPGMREVNREIQGKVVQLKLRDGRTINVVALRVEGESVTWVDRKTNSMRSLPTSSVHELSFHESVTGAFRGLLLGAVLGAAAGGVRASLEGDDPIHEWPAITTEEKMRIFPVAHAVSATLLTTPIGAMLGARKVFRFEHGTAGVPTVTSER